MPERAPGEDQGMVEPGASGGAGPQWPEGGKMSGLVQEARQFRRSDIIMWDLAVRFVQGDQHVVWGSSTRQIIANTSLPGENQTVTNHILGIYRTSVALLMTRFPQLTVVPTTPSTDNLKKAIACEALLHFWWQDQRMDRVLGTVSKWLSMSGNAALHTYFDSERGLPVTECVKSYDLLFEANANSWEESNWRACRKVVLKDALKKAYPKYGKYIDELPSADRDENTSYQNKAMPDGRVDMWDVYFNDGRHGILVGQTWLFKEQLPKGYMPLQPMKWTDVVGRLYGISQVYPLIDLQRQFNRYRNFTLDICDLMSNPIWLVDTGSGLQNSSVTNEAGAIYRYHGNMGNEPKRVDGANVPPQFWEVQRQSQADMMDVGGIHSTTMGKRSGVTAGVAMEELRGGDVLSMESTMASMEHAFKESARCYLFLWKRHVRERRNIAIMDAQVGRVVYDSVADTDLLDNPEVFCEPGSLFSSKVHERNKQVLNLRANHPDLFTAEEIRESLDLPIGRKDKLQAMVNYQIAADMLEVCKRGGSIRVSPASPLKELRDTFSEYVQDPEYYKRALQLDQVLKQAMQLGNEALYVRALAEAKEEKDRMDYIWDWHVVFEMEMQVSPEQLQQLRPQDVPAQQPQGPGYAAGPMASGAGIPGQQRPQDMGNQMSNTRQNAEIMRGRPGLPGAPG